MTPRFYQRMHRAASSTVLVYRRREHVTVHVARRNAAYTQHLLIEVNGIRGTEQPASADRSDGSGGNIFAKC